MTHEVFNQPPLLEDYDSFGADRGLQHAVTRASGAGHSTRLHELGQRCGSAEVIG